MTRSPRGALGGRVEVDHYEARLRADGVLDEDEIARIRSAAAARVEAAIQFAKSSPRPDPAEAGRYVFASAH